MVASSSKRQSAFLLYYMATDTPSKIQNNQSLMERLFSAGSHFGFSKSRRHPTVIPYLFGNKNGTDIIDLEKTVLLIEKACEVLKEAGSEGKVVLFTGTKDEVSALVKSAADEVEAPYVVNRWIGGMLTNLQEIKKRLNRLASLTEESESGELERKYTKKERVVIGREIDKLTFNFAGIRDLDRTPRMMLVVDPRHDSIAVEEANYLGMEIVGIMSSDTDTTKVTYPVIMNDALQSSVELVLGELTKAYKEGKESYVPKPQANKGRTSPQRDRRSFDPRL